MNKEIQNYISKRYNRWHDYAEFHTIQAGLKGESVDVLNTVLLSLLQKDQDYILGLLHSKKGQYCELDFFLLRMIKLNATSDLAPYRFKNKPIPTDANIDYQSLEIEDIKIKEPDTAAEFLENYHTVCSLVSRLDLSKAEKQVFVHVFLMGEPISQYKKSDCTSSELKELYKHWRSIKTAISIILFQERKIKKIPNINKNILRVKSIVNQYNLTKIY